MKLNLRNIVLSTLLAAVISALLYVTFRTDPIPVDLHPVTREHLQITINADGKTNIRDVYEVATPIAGTAIRSPVEVGDTVIGNETVVAVVEPITPSLLDGRSRIQAEAAVREAEAALHVAESEISQAEEELAYAQSQFNRIQTLVMRGVTSETQLEDAAQHVAIRQAAREAAFARLDMATGSLDRARAVLLEPSGGRFGDLPTCCVELRAPIDGTVLSVDVVSERPVSVGTRLVSIGNRNNLEIVADLLSSDAVRIGPGTMAIVERWGGSNRLSARLVSVDPAARTIVSSLGIEEQRVDATFELLSSLEERRGLGDGFSVFLRIIEWQAEDVLQVPLSALFRSGEKWAVFVADGSVTHKTEITIGRRNGTNAEVIDGLDEGKLVITHPSDEIADGVEIVSRSQM